MSSLFVVADEAGNCFEEISAALKPMSAAILQVRAADECVEKARERKPNAIVVYAAMNKAFSLLRLLRHSADLSSIPLVVVADPEQETLIAKHRELPSRADRYLLRPLDGELIRSVMLEFAAGASAPAAPSAPPRSAKVRSELSEDFDAPPDAYQQMEEELTRYRARVAQLEKDMQAFHMVTKELGRLRAENDRLSQALVAEQQTSAAGAEPDFSEMYARLEQGYKETIEDLDRLIREKDDTIARLAESDDNQGLEKQTLMRRVKEEQAKVGEFRKALRHIASLVDELSGIETEVDFESTLDELRTKTSEAARETSFGQEEKTQVVDHENMKKRLFGGPDDI
jgi:hypothetical protein